MYYKLTDDDADRDLYLPRSADSLLPPLTGPALPWPARQQEIRQVDSAVVTTLSATWDRADVAGYTAIRHILYAMMTGDLAQMRAACDAARRHLVIMEQARAADEREK